jgi:hypothetical protein
LGALNYGALLRELVWKRAQAPLEANRYCTIENSLISGLVVMNSSTTQYEDSLLSSQFVKDRNQVPTGHLLLPDYIGKDQNQGLTYRTGGQMNFCKNCQTEP